MTDLSRRTVVACALCATAGLAAAAFGGVSSSAAQTEAIKRKVLQTIDGPMPGYVTIVAEVEIAPGAMVARHTHPGIESSYVIEGEGELMIDGQAKRALSPGVAFQVPVGVPHSAQNGAKTMKLAGTFVVEKDKPLASPA